MPRINYLGDFARIIINKCMVIEILLLKVLCLTRMVINLV